MKVWFPTVRTGSGTDVFTQRLADELTGVGMEAEITWLPHMFELFPFLLRQVPAPSGCDVIHANSWTADSLIGRGVPVVVTVHHLVHDPEYAPYRSLAQAAYHRFHVYPRERRAVERASRVTAVSEYVAGTIRDCFGRQDIAVVPNWVDCDKFSPSEPGTSPGPAGAPLRLLCVGNTSRRKGSDLLMPLMERLGGGYELYCTGGLRNQWSGGRPAGSSSNARIVHLGRLPDDQLVEQYRSCDVAVSLSRYEGFGYSALEAMACAKPVVAFQAGGLKNVVRDGETGYLVPVDDIDAMATRIRQLAAFPELRAKLGAAGRREALRYRQAWQMYVDIYQALLASTRPIRRPA